MSAHVFARQARGPGSKWRTRLRESMALARLENRLPPARLRRCLRVFKATGSLMLAARSIAHDDGRWITVAGMLKRLGLRKPPKRPRRDQQRARDRRILRLRAKGLTYRAVATKVGLSEAAVQRTVQFWRGKAGT